MRNRKYESREGECNFKINIISKCILYLSWLGDHIKSYSFHILFRNNKTWTKYGTLHPTSDVWLILSHDENSQSPPSFSWQNNISYTLARNLNEPRIKVCISTYLIHILDYSYKVSYVLVLDVCRKNSTSRMLTMMGESPWTNTCIWC